MGQLQNSETGQNIVVVRFLIGVLVANLTANDTSFYQDLKA